VIVERTAAVLFGTALVLAVLISALETVVLTRNGYTRIERFVFALMDRILIHPHGNDARQANLRALYAPVALVSLPVVWTLVVTFGFSFIFWGIESGSVQRSFEISGSSLFTLGFAEPVGTARIWLTFVEATIGLGLVALLISYLPTIYSAHNQREKGISVLRPFAGSPPSPVDLLASLQRLNIAGTPEMWRTTTSWLLDLDQTHTAFPALCYFPEVSPDQSWVASVGAVLDGAALLLSAADFSTDENPAEEVKEPMMILAYGVPGLVNIGRSAGLPIDPPPRLVSLIGRSAEAAPPISIDEADYVAALDRLRPLLAVPESEQETCWRRFAWIRSGYDQALRGLAGLTLAPPSPWTTDRPARVGRPHMFRSGPLRVDWSFDTTARADTATGDTPTGDTATGDTPTGG
jgi:hypothetical protein